MARRKTSKAEETPTPYPMHLFFTGLFLVGLGIFLGLSFATSDIRLDPGEAAGRCLTGLVGAWSAYGIVLTFGYPASYLLSSLLLFWGFSVISQRAFLSTWPNVLGGMILLASVALLTAGLGNSLLLPGGLVGHTLAPPLQLYVGTAGLLILGTVLFFLGAVLSFGNGAIQTGTWIFHRLRQASQFLVQFLSQTAAALAQLVRPRLARAVTASAERALVLARPRPAPAEAPPPAPTPEEPSSLHAVEVEASVIEEPAPAAVPVPVPEVETEVPDFVPYGQEEEVVDEIEEPVEEPPAFSARIVQKKPKPKPRRESKPEKLDKIVVEPQSFEDYQLPPLHLLHHVEDDKVEGENSLEKRARILEQTLAEFKIDGRVVQIECGPRITLFEMTLAPGIRLSKVINLADNIAMALKAPNVRIIAPIPGKDTIGIEIPNIEQNLVTLRAVLESINRETRKQALPLCLAKDVGGQAVVADLAKMPHLLIAGATGSGKSVCINSILLSFLMCCKPQDVKCILIDPKVVELSRFKEVPHLMAPVITDMKKAVGVLEWACQQMDERYERLSEVSVNNISKFNALGEEEIRTRLANTYEEDELNLFPKHLPYIVIVIDELADLMMVAGKEVEQHITRLAAKSRAVGIHLILATQRPSVDVITGLIKANMPSRIAFQVASKVDSRTILDQNGAETLLGAGDMLYLPPGVSKVIRCQGVFVNDEELFAVTDFVKAQMQPEYHADLEGPIIGGAGKTNIEDFDELFVEAGAAILESGRGSVSLLQRKLGIGYGRASRIVDQLASVAVLGPFREGKAREIMMTTEEFLTKFDGAQMSLPLEDESDGMAGLREDEREREDVPWDEEE